MFSTGKLNHDLALFREKTIFAFKELFNLFFCRIYIAIALFLNAINWLGSYLMFRSLGEELTVLHYNVTFGVDLIGHRSQLFNNPVSGLILIFLDLVVLLFLVRNKYFKFIAYLIWNAVILVNLFLLLALLAIYLINFR